MGRAHAERALGWWPREWLEIATTPMPWALDTIPGVEVGERRILDADELRARGVRLGDEELDPDYPYYAATREVTCEKAGVTGLSVGRIWDSTAFCD